MITVPTVGDCGVAWASVPPSTEARRFLRVGLDPETNPRQYSILSARPILSGAGGDRVEPLLVESRLGMPRRYRVVEPLLWLLLGYGPVGAVDAGSRLEVVHM